MQKYSALPLGEKLKQLRNAKGLSQENLAKAVNSSESTISRIEQGQTECSMELLEAIKKYMGIDKAPLLKHELIVYEDKVWILNDYANSNRTADARTMQKTMFPIEELPFEHDLTMLYSMVETRLLFQEGNVTAGEEQLKAVETGLEEASVEVNQLYHRNCGFLFGTRGDIKTALMHSLKALNYISEALKPPPALYYNIGGLYAELSRPFHAIKYLERAEIEFNQERTNTIGPLTGHLLGVCYMHVRELDKAKERFDITLAHARSINNELAIGSVLQALGSLSAYANNFKDGLIYSEQALTYLPQHTPHYLYALANKATLLMKMKSFTEFQEVVEAGRLLAKGNEGFTVLFESIWHTMSLKNSESSNYIENVTIPYFKGSTGSLKYAALDYCDILEAHYKKNGSQKKALAIAAITRDIYKEMMFGTSD